MNQVQLYHSDRLVIITKGTLTVQDTTFPLSGILSFRVSETGKRHQNWSLTRKMFARWLAGYGVIGVLVFIFLTSQSLGWLVCLSLFVVACAGVTTKEGDYKDFKPDLYWLEIETTSGRQSVVSSPEPAYIRNLASKLGQAMADRG